MPKQWNTETNFFPEGDSHRQIPNPVSCHALLIQAENDPDQSVKIATAEVWSRLVLTQSHQQTGR